METVVDHLKEGVVEVRFLGQKAKIKWQLEKNVWKKGGGLSLGGRTHTRTVRVFRDLGLFVGVKKTQL